MLFFLTATHPGSGPPLNKSTHEGVSQASPFCQAKRTLEAKLNKLIMSSSNWATNASKQEQTEAAAKQWLKGVTSRVSGPKPEEREPGQGRWEIEGQQEERELNTSQIWGAHCLPYLTVCL